jgi:hypothetical protein
LNVVSDNSSSGLAPAKKRSLTPTIIVLLMTLAPLFGATILYMNPKWWPSDASNYGALITPQRPMPQAQDLTLTTLDGKPFDLQSLQGKWLLLSVDRAECAEECARKLFIARNGHASQGKNVDRLARVWFITDDGPVPEKVLEAYKGTVMLRAKPEQLAAFLLAQTPVQDVAMLNGPIWVIDPLGNLMLQFPVNADGVSVRKDISKLVYNSRIG